MRTPYIPVLIWKLLPVYLAVVIDFERIDSNVLSETCSIALSRLLCSLVD